MLTFVTGPFRSPVHARARPPSSAPRRVPPHHHHSFPQNLLALSLTIPAPHGDATKENHPEEALGLPSSVLAPVGPELSSTPHSGLSTSSPGLLRRGLMLSAGAGSDCCDTATVAASRTHNQRSVRPPRNVPRLCLVGCGWSSSGRRAFRECRECGCDGCGNGWGCPGEPRIPSATATARCWPGRRCRACGGSKPFAGKRIDRPGRERQSRGRGRDSRPKRCLPILTQRS